LRVDDQLLLYGFAVSYKIITYGMLLIVLLYINDYKISIGPVLLLLLLLFSVFKIFFGGSYSNLAFSIPLMIYAYQAVVYRPELVIKPIKALIMITGAVMFLQFVGITDVVYMLSHSSHDDLTEFVYMQADGSLMPAHQHRPHGIFASTIQLSLFSFIVIAVLIGFPGYFSVSYYVMFSIILILAGSMTGVLLLLISGFASFVNKKMLIIFFAGCLLIYYVSDYFPVFYEQNFNLKHFEGSYNSRIDDNREHSFFTKYLSFNVLSKYYYFAVLVLVPLLAVVLLKYGFVVFYSMMILFSLIVGVLLLHPLLNDMRYSLFVALVFSIVVQKMRNKTKFSLNL